MRRLDPSEEDEKAASRPHVSVFPSATPLINGPSSIGAIVLLTIQAEGDRLQYIAVLVALGAILMLVAVQLQRLLGVTGVHVVSCIVGVRPATLAVQFIFDGLAASGLFSREQPPPAGIANSPPWGKIRNGAKTRATAPPNWQIRLFRR